MCTYIEIRVILLNSGKGGFIMALTEAQRKANDKYKAKNIKRVPLDMQITYYETLKAAAEQAGQTVNGYIKQAIAEKMEREAGS